MKTTLKAKMILWIWGLTALLLTFILFIVFNYNLEDIRNEIIKDARDLALYYDKKMEEKFTNASNFAKINAIYTQANPKIKKKELNKYLKAAVKNNPDIYGACIAFEPYIINPKIGKYAPYYYHKGLDLGFSQLAKDKYDYLKKAWYHIPKEKNKPLWSDSYFDEGGGNTIMITYSVPFYKNNKFAGITTADICLNELSNEINKIKLTKTGYSFMVSKKGNFISFPKRSKILSDNIFNFNKNLGKSITSSKPGFIVTNDPLYNKPSWIAHVPIKSSDFYIAFVYPKKEILANIYALERDTVIIGIVSLLILLIIIVIIANSITKPVTQLAQGASRIALGDLEHKISIDTSTKEVAALGLSFNKMVDDLKNRIEEIKNIASENERIAGELDVAREIQMAALPNNFSKFEQEGKISLYANMIPAREVGGDFYDFFYLDKNRLAFIIGDASGKGVAAAIFASICRAFIKATALMGNSPGECLEHVNKLLNSENSLDMFITVFYGILDLSKNEISFCNGGHNPPYIFMEDGNIKPLKILGGIALGVDETAQYQTTTIKSGKGIFLYTDGVTEAENSKEELYTSQRLQKFLNGVQNNLSEKIVKETLEEVKKFSGNNPQSDDITILSIKYK